LDLAEDELERVVGKQGTREQMRLAQNLKAVADAEHEAALARELRDLLHHRRKPRDRPDAQVVAVGEAARDDHRVDALKVAVGVPQEHRLADSRGGVERVDLVARSRETHHPELQRALSAWMTAGSASIDSTIS